MEEAKQEVTVNGLVYVLGGILFLKLMSSPSSPPV